MFISSEGKKRRKTWDYSAEKKNPLENITTILYWKKERKKKKDQNSIQEKYPSKISAK